MRKRITIEDVKTLARRKGIRCLSTKYINSRAKLSWKCARGHEWDAPLNAINAGHSCQVCGRIQAADKLRGTLKEMQAIARKKRGACLSKKYVNSQAHLKFRCKAGHVWKAIPCSIKQGRWCRVCGFSAGWKKRHVAIKAGRSRK